MALPLALSPLRPQQRDEILWRYRPAEIIALQPIAEIAAQEFHLCCGLHGFGNDFQNETVPHGSEIVSAELCRGETFTEPAIDGGPGSWGKKRAAASWSAEELITT